VLSDEDQGRSFFLFLVIAVTILLFGNAYHWFDGIIALFFQLIPLVVIIVVIGAAIYLIYYLKNYSKRRKDQEEIDILREKGKERRKILENLRWWDFNDYILADILLGQKTDDEFNSLITELNQKKELEEQYRQSLISRVMESIENFIPTKKWGNEDSYHKELLGWLKQPFPEIQYELQTGGSRPDLVIGKIAIEIKGPTDDNALNTLATKILKYSHYYENVVIVLFEPSFSERNFKEITSGIEKTYSHVHVIRK